MRHGDQVTDLGRDFGPRRGAESKAVVSLLEAGFIDVICSTGAQVYHDLHFAFGLPVKAIHPQADDDRLRAHGGRQGDLGTQGGR